MLYYLSLGSNLGQREQTLREALTNIEQQVGHIFRCSNLYYSAPWGFESGNTFCNLCCAVESEASPYEVLAITQHIERQLGRTKKTQTTAQNTPVYSDRNIDIDIIRVFDGETEVHISSPELTIPHPLWHLRDFVTIPLKEICSQLSDL